jgi:hypothetical protein
VLRRLKNLVSNGKQFDLIALDINFPDILIEKNLNELKNLIEYQAGFALIGPHYSQDY